jgi:hypothetical protein
MSRIRQYFVATGTFAVALGIGFVMQNGDALAARFSDTATEPALAQVTLGSVRPMARPATLMPVEMTVEPVSLTLAPDVVAPALISPEIPVPEVTSLVEATDAVSAGPLSQSPVVLAAVTPSDMLPELGPDMSQSPVLPEPDCTVTLDAAASPAAMVDLVLTAACSPLATAMIHHQGMTFSITTDDAGLARVAVPALSESAVIIADLGNGEGAVAVTTVPDFAQFDRVVLQWQGSAGPEIHALEFGASYGEAGHVWHGAAQSADMAIAGTGGFLVQLGDGQGLNPFRAEVYTYPSGNSRQSGQVSFSIETPVTEAICGTEMAAQTIQASPGADLFALDLSMAIPACESVGEILVLKNMLLDLTLAAK